MTDLSKQPDSAKIDFLMTIVEEASEKLRRIGCEESAARYAGYVREMRGSNGIQTVEVAKTRPNTAAPQGVAYAELPDCDLRTLAGNTAFSYAQKTYAAPRYLPRTPGEAAVFEPHGWVIDAMKNAIKLAALRASNGQAPAGATYEKELEEALRERDDADDFIDALLDEVLGADRAEWSSAYGRADALEEVRDRITALHKPAVDRAWAQFQAAPLQAGASLIMQVGTQGFDLASTSAHFTARDMYTASAQAFREGQAAPTAPAAAKEPSP